MSSSCRRKQETGEKRKYPSRIALVNRSPSESDDESVALLGRPSTFRSNDVSVTERALKSLDARYGSLDDVFK